MKFLKVTDEYEHVQLLNPKFIRRVYVPENDDRARIVFADAERTLAVNAPTFDEIAAQLTGVPMMEEEVE